LARASATVAQSRPVEARVPVAFGALVDGDDVDGALVDALRSLPTNAESGYAFTFDFSDARFMLPTGLQCTIAAARRLSSLGNQVEIRVPRDKRVRDFWRVWNFPKAFLEATGLGFGSVVHADDRRFFGEKQTTYTEIEIPPLPGFADASKVLSNNFFGFRTSYFDPKELSSRLAYVEKNRWNAPHIELVLGKKLGAHSKYFASRVVFEAILNAIRHPGATLAQSAALDQPTARISEQRTRNETAYFTVHFWDDGNSMIQTLLDAIASGVSVKGDHDQEFNRKYLLKISDDDSTAPPSLSVVDSANIELGDGVLPYPHMALLATILPCVTSDPGGVRHHEVPPETLKADVRLGRPGMGLYVLVNTIVEILGGSVSFRTGDYFMNVRSTNSHEKSKYNAQLRVRLRKRPKCLPSFFGNLVVVRARTSAQS
jgi:hypothetical protein